jgi:hypothetical protein
MKKVSMFIPCLVGLLLPELLEQFENNAPYHGAKVFWTRAAKEEERVLSVYDNRSATDLE